MTWTPIRDQVGRHEIQIEVRQGTSKTLHGLEIEVVSSADATAVAGDLSKIDDLYTLKLDEKERIVPGLDGKSMLLLSGATLKRLGPDGLKVIHEYTLPRDYDWIGERETTLVAMSHEGNVLDVLDKRTLKVTRSVKMDYKWKYDLCLHPDRDMSYVTVGRFVDGLLLNVILEVDETTGDVREREDFIGTWLKISPDGQKLYAGFTATYEKGQRLLVNPDRLHIVPEYGSVDLLIAYDISKNVPRVIDASKNVGANGTGIVLSGDGKRISYLSFVGYPTFSKSIGAWDTKDFEKRPVTYAVQEMEGDCRRLAFHPVLEIAAAPGPDGALFFARETGDSQPDRVRPRRSLNGATIQDLYFSPDGRNILMVCELAGERFLVREALRLTAEEEATLKRPSRPQRRPAPKPPSDTQKT